MTDLLFLALTGIVALLSWGFVVLCEKLAGGSR
jgi:hypothetical protein